MRFSVTRRGAHGIRIWPLRRDERSGFLIDAGGKWRSDWPEHVKAVGDSTRAGVSGSLHSIVTGSFQWDYVNTW